jgi:acyl-coenzyme A thioesterase PaaI-like protein
VSWPRFEPKNPAWRAAATSTFDLQPAMRSLSISIVRLEPGEVTVEFKTNLLAPARAERFLFRARVLKPGRTLTVCEAQAFATHESDGNPVATMTGTLMALPLRQPPG